MKKSIFWSVLCLILTVCSAVPSFAAEQKKRIMVYGDSNSFGWTVRENGSFARLPPEITWPKRMETLLGNGYEVITEALGGRTTNINCSPNSGTGYIPGAGMNGAAYLPAALSSHLPLDLVIIMLGTNDLRKDHNRNARDIADGVDELIKTVKEGKWQKNTDYKAPQVLVLAPPKLDIKNGKYKSQFEGSLEKSSQFAAVLKKTADSNNAAFFDAASVVPFGEAEDEIHLTPENHNALAHAAAREVKKIFNDSTPLQEINSPFAQGSPNTAYAQYFIGNSWLNMLSTEGVIIGNVTFEPGCRNNWHIHHADKGGGQILLCTAGKGWYQEWGQPARELKSGDVVIIPAGVKHWHGAAKDSWFVHLAVEVPGENTKNEWLEPVSDTEYNKLP